MDPMDSPPTDYGSDRYDYVDVEAPEGIDPSGPWFEDLIAEPCSDCNANVFLKWAPPAANGIASSVFCWQITVAHDETCPAPLNAPPPRWPGWPGGHH